MATCAGCGRKSACARTWKASSILHHREEMQTGVLPDQPDDGILAQYI